MLKIEDSTLFLKVENDLSIYQVEELLKELRDSFDNAREVVVDMSKADKIDTAGFQLLASLKKSCEAAGKSFKLLELGSSAQNFTELFSFDWNSPTKAANASS